MDSSVTLLFIIVAFSLGGVIILQRDKIPNVFRRGLALFAIGFILFAFFLIVYSLFTAGS